MPRESRWGAMALVLDWQKKLGFTKDPFSSDATPTRLYVVGLEQLQERINLFLIKDERFGTISGPRGMGKSILLQWINEELAPQKSHNQVFINAKDTNREEIVSRLLAEKLSFLEKKFNNPLKLASELQERELLQRLAKEQKNIFLIDNAGALGKPELALLQIILDKTPTDIILSDTHERLSHLQFPMADKLKLQLPRYTHEQLRRLIELRIKGAGGSGIFPFSEEDIEYLVKKSDGNPQDLLELARERAIEKSLKVTTPTKPIATPVEKQGRFLSIKIEKKKESQEEYFGNTLTTKTSPQDTLTTDAEQDAELLAQMIQPSLQAREPMLELKSTDAKPIAHHTPHERAKAAKKTKKR